MKKIIKFLISFILTIVLLFFLLRYVNFVDIKESFLSFPLWIIFLGFVFYSATYFLRALRFKILLKNSLSFFELFFIVSIHNFFIQIIPARLGELSYIFLLKRKKVPFQNNISSLIIVRVMDFIFVTIFFFIGLFSVFQILENFYLISFITLLTFLFLFSVLFLLIMKPNIFLTIISFFETKFFKNNILKFLTEKTKELIKGFKILKSKKVFLQLFFLSFTIWLLLYLFTYLFLKTLFPELSFVLTLFIASLPVFISILPINGIAGFGTIEVGYLFPLILLGIKTSEAITAGLIIHMIQLSFLIIFGIIGLIGLIISKK